MQYKAATNLNQEKIKQRLENIQNAGKLILQIQEEEPNFIFHGSFDQKL